MRKIVLTVMTLASVFTMKMVSAQYCVPTYATGCGSGDEIDDFEIPTGGLSHLGSGCSAAAYGDFTGNASLEADLQISETYAFTATHNFGSQYISIWIDFDNSGVFDPGELLFTSSAGGNSTSGSITIPVSATTTTTVMRVVDNYSSAPNGPCNPGSSWGETHDYTVNILPAPTCPTPTNLAASNITTTDVDLNWTNGGTETAWNIEYGPVGFTPGTGTVVAAGSNPFTLTGLTPSTDYDIYVQADCGGGDLSNNSVPVSITTNCVPFTATYTQNFDAVTTPDLPTCWSGILNSSSTAAYLETSTFTTPNSAPNHVRMYNSATAGATSDLMLISPQFSDLPAATNQIRFYAKTGTNPEDLIVGTMSDPSDPNTFTPYSTISTLTNTYEEYTISFGAYTGSDEYIALKHGNTAATRYIYIDDFVYEPLPSCPAPFDMSVLNTTSNSIELGWTNGASETAWNIEYGPVGFTQGTGTIVAANSNPFTITGLNDGQAYEFYIQADCGPGDQSTWFGPINGATNCLTFMAPFTEDFENANWISGTGASNNGDGIDNCWSRNPATSASFFWGTRTGTTSSGSTGPTGDNTTGSGKYIFTEGSNGGTGDWATITSPVIDISGLTNPIVEYYYHFYGANIDTFFVDAYDGSAWNTVDTIVGQFQTANADPWEYRFVNVSAVALGITDFQFRFRAKRGTSFNADYAIDDVGVVEEPVCLPPSNLMASNPTASSIDLAWTNGDNETAWNIEYGPVGFTQGTGTVVAANSNPFTVTGLNDATEYDFYVQADCGGGDVSAWYGTATETTSCLPFTVPYLESFSSGSQPICSDNYSVDGSTSASAMWKFTGNPDYGAVSNGKPGGTFAWVDGSTPSSSQAVFQSNWIDMTGLTTPMLSFELFSNNTDNPGDNMTFSVEIDDGSTTTTIFTFAGDSSEWMLHQVDLSAYVGQTVRFNFVVDQTTANTAYYNDILLDEFAICEAEDAGFTYSDSVMCIQSNSEMPNISGMAGGTFDAPAGLDIDANTGEINPSNSTPGVYDVTYTTSTDPCRGTETFTVEVVSFEDASFDYAETELCPLDDNITANVTGLAGGTFSSGAGLDLDPNTGEIDPLASTPGMYTVTYTSSTTACATSETFDIEIIEGEDASFGYGGTEFCINYEDVVPTITGDQGGTFSTEPGMAINGLTGQVGAEASTPGTYWVYYTTSGSTGCVGVDSVEITIDECLGLNENAMSSISVYPNPANEVVNYVLPEMTGAVNVTMMDATGKVVYENQVNGNAGSQEINVGKFENGMYMITFKNNDQMITRRVVISR